jgi:hypothetical protein
VSAPGFGWFVREGEAFLPQPLAQSLWSKDQVHGVAVSGLLALALEGAVQDAGRTDLLPVRYQVDLFRPARMTPTTVRATVVRESARLMLLDAVVEQAGEPVARAGATFLKPSEPPPGEIWSSLDRATPPPEDLLPPRGEQHVPVFASDKDWSDNFADHQNAGRHTTWHTGVPTVVGEPLSPFQAVASIADTASMTTNWGTGGVEYINTDINLAISRLPEDISVGLRATDHVAHDGVAVGVAEVFDRRGTIGTVSVASLANTRRSVDFSGAGDGTKAPPGV